MVLLRYIKTRRGDELLTRTSIISEEVEQERIRKRKFQIPMSDEPGEYDEAELRQKLTTYLRGDLHSARRIKNVLIPACLEQDVITRDELKEEFVKRGEADNTRDAGYFIPLMSQQLGMQKNDFLRQIIGYKYPNYPWEKDNYTLRGKYRELVEEVLGELEE